ncbi:hypothetical protein PIB30_076815 [Stylosanthes scabra]|uniref:Aminotransferase-like plant mobile domain-containing protein n=1 Tax=Stylosanthes scabra TaxID=79078 RepID=A0ABU6YT32_9FABA|nr:hypothetical protein [Stylosanthes scabra]
MRSTGDVMDLSEVSTVVPASEERSHVSACCEFVCTPYDDPAWDTLRPAWMLTVEEQLTWRAVVPIVWFMYVRMHHVNRVKRQLRREQQVPADPVNLDGFLSSSASGEDQWWTTKNAEWYDAWRGRFGEEQQVTITPTAYPAMATQEYFTWWIAACRHCYLSRPDALDDTRLEDLPEDIPLTMSQPRDALRFPGNVPIMHRRRRDFRPDIQRHVRGGRGRGPNGEPQRPVGAMDSRRRRSMLGRRTSPVLPGMAVRPSPSRGRLSRSISSQSPRVHRGIRDSMSVWTMISLPGPRLILRRGLGSGSMLQLGMLISILDSSPLYRVPRSRPLLRDTRG